MLNAHKDNLVKRLRKVKNDISVEAEFMPFLKEFEAQFRNYKLLERDREKIEEGREEGIILTK